MNAFSNENLKTKLCGGCDCTAFVPKVDISLNSGTKVLTVTDSSTYDSGDARKVVHLTVVDRNAKKIQSNIPAADGDGIITMDLSTLDHSEGLVVMATVVTNKGCLSDGSYRGLGVLALVGTLGGWDKDYNAITI